MISAATSILTHYESRFSFPVDDWVDKLNQLKKEVEAKIE